LDARARFGGPSAFQTRLESRLVARARVRNDLPIELPISHRDVTTIMSVLGDIREDVNAIRRVLEEDDGEEEEDSEEDT
jgi:hypothetical protein